MTAPRPGSPLPRLRLAVLDGSSHDPGEKTGQWQMLVIYRGRHCPRCKSYLSKLDGMREAFAERGVHIVIASADPIEKAQADVAEFGWKLPCAYGLSEVDMQALGLYISDPSSPQETARTVRCQSGWPVACCRPVQCGVVPA
jgi:peroxiredoxin